MNFNAISGRNPWIKDEFPEFTKENDDFVFLWKPAVLPVYPAAVPSKGYIDKINLNPDTFGNCNVALLSIDSAKRQVPSGTLTFRCRRVVSAS